LDDKIFAFKDGNAQAKKHFLVCSIAHIKNIDHLTKKHLPLLKHMKDVAMKLLMDKPAEENDKISVKVIDTD
jgi:diadenosine tetraphosphate (Ap4A) HIT family hydrolase